MQTWRTHNLSQASNISGTDGFKFVDGWAPLQVRWGFNTKNGNRANQEFVIWAMEMDLENGIKNHPTTSIGMVKIGLDIKRYQ